MERKNTVELLAPAGQWDALRAAVANGADAVYFGLEAFNARRRAKNFSLDELPEVMGFLHAHNARGYVALNTLIFSDELARAGGFVAGVAAAGADAVIVQDVGLARLIARTAPSLAIHASTQMTLTEPRGIEFSRRLGVGRVILARELSLGEIATIAAATDVELEVFVHGALCISFSGQCLASESIFGRSANRGLCAQACRLPYELVGPAGDAPLPPHLLSPCDLGAFDLIGQLIAAGVTGFKIEGRLKSPHYVAAVTAVYRAAIDAALARRPFTLSDTHRRWLAQSFSRGLGHGFLEGSNRRLVEGDAPDRKGVLVGTVTGRTPRGILIRRPAPTDTGEDGAALTMLSSTFTTLKNGDGVVIVSAEGEADQGGRVYSARPVAGGQVELTFGRDAVDLAAVAIGSQVRKTDDPAVAAEIEATYARDLVVRRVPVTIAARAGAGAKLEIVIRDDCGNAAAVESGEPLPEARNQPLTRDLLAEQFARLGQTPFELASAELTSIGPPAMAPKSVLNDLRRQATDALVELRRRQAQHAITDADALTHLRQEDRRVARPPSAGDSAIQPVAQPPSAGSSESPVPPLTTNAPALYALVRTADQLSAVLRWRPPAGAVGLAGVYLDLADPRQLDVCVGRCRDGGLSVGLATPRILLPGEESHLGRLLAAQPDTLLARNLGSLAYLAERVPAAALVGDFSLNAVNELSAAAMLKASLRRVVPGYDLNFPQLAALVGEFAPAALEIVIHQHVPLFHTRHCIKAVGCAGVVCLHTVGPKTVCSRTATTGCTPYELLLRDRTGAEHSLFIDEFCRNTVFSSHAQSAAHFAADMLTLGLRHFRVEFVAEAGELVGPVLDAYAMLLAGQSAGAAAWRDLQNLYPDRLTRGTWQVIEERPTGTADRGTGNRRP
jgi:putative protease